MTQWSQPSMTGFKPQLSRRCFLKYGVILAATCLTPHVTLARPHQDRSRVAEKILTLYNTHTGENLTTVYWAQGDYVVEAIADINHILRDHRVNATTSMDLDLLDFLHAIQQKLDSREPFHVISGYRTPATNALLRRRSKRVSKHSLHMQGKAVDISLPGYGTQTVRRAALSLSRGGVGYYPHSNFIHVDTGPVRSW
jgi:uncharacterized protein YcbK (DUF882 family)